MKKADFGSPDFGSLGFGSPDFGSPDFGAVTAMDIDNSILVDVRPHSPMETSYEVEARGGGRELVMDAQAKFYPNKTEFNEVATEADIMNYLSQGAVSVTDEIKRITRDSLSVWNSLNDAQSEAVTEVTATATDAAPSLAEKFQALPSAGKLGVAAAGYMAMKMVPKQYLFGGLALFMFLRMQNKEVVAKQITQTVEDTVNGMC